jgi:hypothetical protein
VVALTAARYGALREAHVRDMTEERLLVHSPAGLRLEGVTESRAYGACGQEGVGSRSAMLSM